MVLDPVPDVPSPNDQAHDATAPSGSCDADPSNVTVSGATPDEGAAETTAIGGAGPTLPGTRQHRLRDVDPQHAPLGTDEIGQLQQRLPATTAHVHHALAAREPEARHRLAPELIELRVGLLLQERPGRS